MANYLRLLKLPAPVQMALQNRQIDTGHARALLALEDPKEQVRLFREVQQKGYSVRQVEGSNRIWYDRRRTITLPRELVQMAL